MAGATTLVIGSALLNREDPRSPTAPVRIARESIVLRWLGPEVKKHLTARCVSLVQLEIIEAGLAADNNYYRVFVKSGRQNFRMFKSGWHLQQW